MYVASIALFVPALILVLAGGGTAFVAIRALRRRVSRRAAAVLRLIAGIGTLACAALALSFFWSDVQYGVIIIPIAALFCAALWNALLLTAAFLVENFSPRGVDR